MRGRWRNDARMRFDVDEGFSWAWRALAGAAVCLLCGCASRPGRVPLPTGQADFAQYRDDARAWLAANRDFQSGDRAAELDWNAPREWRPPSGAGATPPRGGVLLVHGLGDSPFSLADIGAELARRGWLARTLLLPGHGGEPADLLRARAGDWRRLVAEQTRLLEADAGAGPVFLGGFSTGANLALAVAADDGRVAGLLLFSPAFKAVSRHAWAAGWLAPFKPWLRKPVAGRSRQSPVRYTDVPTNGFAQFHRTSVWARAALRRRGFGRPALLVVAERDSVVDVRRVAELFAKRFTHPASRLVWYGMNPPESGDARIVARADYLPDMRISNFSHMGVLFSPENPLYGLGGALPVWRNGQGADAEHRRAAGEPVWYSAWGYREPGKVHARLTFNPYFDWQLDLAESVMQAAEAARQ
ncbi:MAG: lysophospholipase [Opitutaceae bacterium]|nr:lysophospholipase [Opitutaceae bacterium]